MSPDLALAATRPDLALAATRPGLGVLAGLRPELAAVTAVRPHFTVVIAVALGLLGFGVGVFGTLVGAGGGFILTRVLLLLYQQSTLALMTEFRMVVVFFNAGSGWIG
jgi:uncharacterized membrane protein YfcA